MVLAWLIGVQALSDSFATLLFLREGNLPDVGALARAVKDTPEPIEALMVLQEGARMRAIGEAARLAFPLTVGRFLLAILLVISSGMAMSGRPGARRLSMQALFANAALATASFWLLREARYAWIDVVVRIRDVVPHLPATSPADQQQAWSLLLDKRLWLWLTRLRLAMFDIGALLLAASTLTSPRAKAFFDAVAASTAEPEEP
jgi:hypothetical protein